MGPIERELRDAVDWHEHRLHAWALSSASPPAFELLNGAALSLGCQSMFGALMARRTPEMFSAAIEAAAELKL